jgi:hypothetical protein
MLKSFMFASQPHHASNLPRRLHPLHSTHCHPHFTHRHPHSNPCLPERSEGPAFLSRIAPRRSPLALPPVTPFLVYPEPRRATLSPREEPRGTVTSQLTENPATLSPLLATLTRRVKPNPFVCHSYKKHPGVGVPHQVFPLSYSSIFSVNSALAVPGVYPGRVGALKYPFKSTTVPPLKQKPMPHALFSLFCQKCQMLTPLFSYFSALFKKECLPKPFAIRLFPTLLQNTRGWPLSAPLSFHRDRPDLIHLLERTSRFFLFLSAVSRTREAGASTLQGV